MKDEGDGSGFVVADVGNVDVTLTDSNGANSVLDAGNSSCDDNQPTGDNLDGSGQCTTVFTSNDAGTVTGHATVNLTVGGVALFRETDNVSPNSDDAVKLFVDGSLVWHKEDNLGNPLGGATFEVCRTHTLDTSTSTMVDTTDVCFPVEDNVSPDADAADGEFLVEDLVLGRYTVQETAAPPGFTIVNPDPVIAPDMSLANPDVEIVVPFVNIPPPEGCTPGFWGGGTGAFMWDETSDPVVQALIAAGVTVASNPHDTLWHPVFSLTPNPSDNLPDGVTLFGTTPQGGEAKGGGNAKVARFGTANLLNAAAQDAALLPGFGLSVPEVIALVQAAWNGGDAQALTDLVTAANKDCPF